MLAITCHIIYSIIPHSLQSGARVAICELVRTLVSSAGVLRVHATALIWAEVISLPLTRHHKRKFPESSCTFQSKKRQPETFLQFNL